MKMLTFDSYFTKVSSYVSKWHYISFSIDNGLVPNSRQAIIWTNGDIGYSPIYMYMGLSASVR